MKLECSRRDCRRILVDRDEEQGGIERRHYEERPQHGTAKSDRAARAGRNVELVGQG
ncbi:MAG: hypothetical protein IRZ04_02675 [Rhodospirillales bacterium]|nr:hypothetical protein [Rhodospirillales bacterium]